MLGEKKKEEREEEKEREKEWYSKIHGERMRKWRQTVFCGSVRTWSCHKLGSANVSLFTRGYTSFAHTLRLCSFMRGYLSNTHIRPGRKNGKREDIPAQ